MISKSTGIAEEEPNGKSTEDLQIEPENQTTTNLLVAGMKGIKNLLMVHFSHGYFENKSLGKPKTTATRSESSAELEGRSSDVDRVKVSSERRTSSFGETSEKGP